MTTLRFDNLQEQLMEFRKVLYLGVVFYYNQKYNLDLVKDVIEISWVEP